MKKWKKALPLASCVLWLGLGSPSWSQVLYSQAPITVGATLIQSSWFAPDGLDSDVYTWDSFQLTSTADIAKIDWRGSASATKNFNIAIYPSIAGGSQPLVTTPDTNGNTALVAYNVAGLAGASVGTFNGIAMYDYHFDLPTTFQAQANTKYWLRILGDDGSWGWASATGGDGRNFQYYTGLSRFLIGAGDTGFTLSGSGTIPEPSSLMLVMGGFLCAILLKNQLVSR